MYSKRGGENNESHWAFWWYSITRQQWVGDDRAIIQYELVWKACSIYIVHNTALQTASNFPMVLVSHAQLKYWYMAYEESIYLFGHVISKFYPYI